MPATRPARAASAPWRAALLGAVLVSALAPAVFAAQPRPPLPDRAEIARLVWSTLIAVDQADKTGNYSVLQDLGAPGFRDANDPAKLAAIFARFRHPDIGLGRAVLYTPQYTQPPAIQTNGMLRVEGLIPMRPEGILFNMAFQQIDGVWRLFGIGLAPEQPKPIEGSGNKPVAKPNVKPHARKN